MLVPYVYLLNVYVQITQVTPSRALQTTSGWADSYAVTWNAVMGHTLATRVDSLKGRGCCRKCSVLQVQRCVHLDNQFTTRPRAVGWGGLYSW